MLKKDPDDFDKLTRIILDDFPDDYSARKRLIKTALSGAYNSGFDVGVYAEQLMQGLVALGEGLTVDDES